MTYQGRLTDASNAPVSDGTGYEIEVRLWNAPTGGTLLWGTRYTGFLIPKRCIETRNETSKYKKLQIHIS